MSNATLCEDVSVWSSAVIRADNDSIFIGAGTNIQEGAVLHADPDFPLKVGKKVTIGHQAMLHGCTIEDGALIGIQAVVLNGAVIGKNCLVGAGALVTEGKFFLITLSFLVPRKSSSRSIRRSIANYATRHMGLCFAWTPIQKDAKKNWIDASQ
ncbi:MAG: hypothetical protein CM15mP14_0960 [Rhodospirillaceae bacterium]|nr:MAG: hypothetical protein CM15mP14_0960 [Rhodospirillaceae bacterium]